MATITVHVKTPKEKKPKEPETTVTPKKVSATKAPKEIKEQKVVKPIIEKKGPKKPTEDEKAKMAEVPIPSQKTTTKTTETKPDICEFKILYIHSENKQVLERIHTRCGRLALVCSALCSFMLLYSELFCTV